MIPRGRPRKRHPVEEAPTFTSKPDTTLTETKPDAEEKFPYKEGQICADVKIVEIKPNIERSIGFVYAKHGVIKDDKDRIVNTTGILQGKWQEQVHWMTVSDFKSFVKAQIENGQFVKEGM